MPHVSNNYDPLLDRVIFAYDGTNYRVVKVDTSGQLVAAVAAGQTIKVTQDTAANLLATVNLATDQNVQARAHGYDGAAWRKLQQLWGYTDRWNQEVSNLSAAAGSNTLTCTAVAAGYVHVLQGVTVVDLNSATTQAQIRLPMGSQNLYLLSNAGGAAGTRQSWQGQLTMKQGDTVQGILGGCTLNDDIYLAVWGYKMKIND